MDLTIYPTSRSLRVTPEIMFPMLGAASYLQPFRSTGLGEQKLHAIDAEVTGLQSLTKRAILDCEPAILPGIV